MEKRVVYRVSFFNQGKVYELFAREVSHGSMLGFVEIGDLLFGTTGSVVVDPSEERLKSEFEGVKRFFVPVHAIVRIDELEKGGTAKITPVSASDNVAPFPTHLYTPGGSNKP